MSRLLRISFGLLTLAVVSQAAALICVPAGGTPVVHSEGIAEQVGNIVLKCSGGAPGGTIGGNLSVFLPVNDTNRIQANGSLDVTLMIDNSGTPQPANVPAVLTSATSIGWIGLSFNLSPTGTVVLTISNVRANAAQSPSMFLSAFVSFTGVSTLALTSSQLAVGVPITSLFATTSSVLFCPASGSPVPKVVSFENLLSTGSIFNTARVTEGYPDAFAPKSDPSNATSDTGTRIILQFSGFPSVARLFVPTFVAGSTADVPTAAGDLGLPASGGQYTPGKGQLLLALVSGADANGAGGTVAAPPAATTAFTDVAEIPMSGGAGNAVFEVVDANPSIRESAQIPTWLGAVGYEPTSSVQPTENVFLAPVSTVVTASPDAPIPRFRAVTPPSDCGLLGDCKANYFPHLFVDTTPIAVTVAANQVQRFYPTIRNTGSGAMAWNASVQYTSGSNWIVLTGAQGVNNSLLRIDVVPAGLAPGVYQANVVIDAGAAGTEAIPVTATVVAAVPQPLIKAVTSSAAPFNGGVVADSLVTIWGHNLAGNAVVVTFDGIPADLLYDGPTQINVHVPASATGHAGNSGSRGVFVVVTVDGQSSPILGAGMLDLAPAIFTGGVINQDTTVNSASSAAPGGTIVAVYATGLATSGTITAKIQDREIPNPVYAGPAPTVPGVQQVNIRVPSDLPAGQTFVWVCGTTSANPSQKVCSAATPIWVSQ
jgi:uncharacterized protein (TIGR03437 family)